MIPALTKYRNAGSTDPYFSNVALLMHMEGSDGGTSFSDSSSSHKTCTAFTGTTTSTANKKFGSSSCLVTGTDSGGISLASSADFGFGTGDFTIEGWVLPSSVTTRLNTLFDSRISSATGLQVFVGGGTYSQPPSILGCSSNSAVLATGGTVNAGSWSHVAVTRASNTLRGFVNGALAFTVTDSRAYASSAAVYLGRDSAGSASQGFSGYMDDVRVTKGVARYTSAFTVPAAAFPDS